MEATQSSYCEAMHFSVTSLQEEGKQVHLEAANLFYFHSLSGVFSEGPGLLSACDCKCECKFSEGLIFIAEFWMKNSLENGGLSKKIIWNQA